MLLENPGWMDCPCIGCDVTKGRSETCHTTCEKYLKWRSWLDLRNEYDKQQKILGQHVRPLNEPVRRHK